MVRLTVVSTPAWQAGAASSQVNTGAGVGKGLSRELRRLIRATGPTLRKVKGHDKKSK